MNNHDQSGELEQLRAQLAELTRRVFELERLTAERIAPPPSPAEAAPSLVSNIPPAPLVADAAPPSSNLPPPARMVPPPPAFAIPRARPQRPEVSLESRVGGQWLNRIGIVAVLVGLSYFLKLAFENNWIGPAVQVAIGIVAGVGLLLWSERFRQKGFGAFAYSLKAVAIGALYLSLWAASQYYHLVPPSVSFFAMVAVTLTSAALALRQDAELLAAFALVGGMLTPVLISTGQNHEFALFCYVALLDLGTLWVASIKRWQRLLLGAFVGSAALFAAWASTYYTPPQLNPTWAFATLFFLIFAAAPLAPGATATSRDYLQSLALLNAAAYFAACYMMLYPGNRSELAVLCVVVASLLFVIARKLDKSDPRSAAAHVALAVGYFSVAIPIQLESYWISFGWLVEAAALFWAAHRSRSRLLRLLGLASLMLGAARLIGLDSVAYQPPILNPRFGLYLLAIGALALIAYYASIEGGEENRTWSAGAIIGLNMMALIALHCEVLDYFSVQRGHIVSSAEWRSLHIARDFTYSAVWMLYASALMLIGFRKKSAFLRWQAIVLFALTAAKVFFYDISALERGYRILTFIVLGGILLTVSFFYQRSRIKAAE